MIIKESLGRRQFYYSACLVCLETENIKKCSRCKITPYCGKDHQKSDFPYHKQFCKAICDLQAMFNVSSYVMNDITYRTRIHEALIKKLGRRLKHYEEMSLFRNECCIVCSVTSNLILCPTCKCESFCHMHYETNYNKHKEYCLELKYHFDYDKYTLHNTDCPDMHISPVIDKDCALEDAHKHLIFERELKYPETLVPYLVLNPTLIVLYALGKLGLIDKNRQFIRNDLIIHIMGTVNFSSDFFCHWLTNLKMIKYIYFYTSDNCQCRMYDLCDGCKKTKQVEVKYHEEAYDEVYYATSPDLIIIQAEGLGFFLSKDAYRTVFDKKKPVCVLCVLYDYEITMDDELSVVDEIGSVKYYLKNENNPFRSKLPLRSKPRLDGKTCFYHHEKISLFVPN